MLVLIGVHFYAGRAYWQQTLFALTEIGDGLLGMIGALDFLLEGGLGE